MPTMLLKTVASVIAGATLALGAVAGPDKSNDEHDMHAAHRAQMAEDKGQKVVAADVSLSDAVMLDQTGAERQMKSEIVGDRIVVVDFIYTSCTTICPVTTALLAQARTKMTDIDDDTVAFVSMSIDANTDTPARLAEFAERAGADWTFLTGDKRVMDEALTAMDAYATNPEDHAPMILIGDASTGKFKRIFGLPNPKLIEDEVRMLISMRADGASDHQHHH